MKIIFIDNKNKIELSGNVRKEKNRFYIDIEVDINSKLKDLIDNIHATYDKIGNITCINNKQISATGSQATPNHIIYTYECGYIITGHIDNIYKIKFKKIGLYFKESDYFFVKDRYKVDIKKLGKSLTITQKYKQKKLIENEKFTINIIKTAGMRVDQYGQKIFSTPNYISLDFKQDITINEIFDYNRNIESCFGFILSRKVNLIEFSIADESGVYHDIIVKNMKDYKEILLDDFHIVDLNSEKLLKDVMKLYFEDEFVMASINTYYEFLYNDLEDIFEFSSIINTLELICCHKQHSTRIINYSKKNNPHLIKNNDRIKKITKAMNNEDKKFIYGFYNPNHVELKDKLSYILYDVFQLHKSDDSDVYISEVVATRNYYIHGTRKKKILSSVKLFLTKALFRDILYVTIIGVCSKSNNILTETYKLSIPTVYDSIVKINNKS